MCKYDNEQTEAVVQKLAEILSAEDAMVSSHALVWFTNSYLRAAKENIGEHFATAVAGELLESIMNVIPDEGTVN